MKNIVLNTSNFFSSFSTATIFPIPAVTPANKALMYPLIRFRIKRQLEYIPVATKLTSFVIIRLSVELTKQSPIFATINPDIFF